MGEETAAVRPEEEMTKMPKRIIGITTRRLAFVKPTAKGLSETRYLAL
jgi:hypothetical protein